MVKYYGFLIWVNGTEKLIDIEALSEEEAHKKIRDFCDEHFEKIEKIEFLGEELIKGERR